MSGGWWVRVTQSRMEACAAAGSSGFAVWMAYALHADRETGLAYPSLRRVAELAGISPEQARRVRGRLAEAGELRVEPMYQPAGTRAREPAGDRQPNSPPNVYVLQLPPTEYSGLEPPDRGLPTPDTGGTSRKRRGATTVRRGNKNHHETRTRPRPKSDAGSLFSPILNGVGSTSALANEDEDE